MLRLFNSRPGTCVCGLVLGGVAAISGCNHGPSMVQAKGKVSYKDGSVPKGGVRVIRFEPAAESTAEVRKGASGAIESDGSFEVYTRKPGDGIYVGEYDVTFAVQPGPMDPTSLILPKYTSKATTPYKKITIDKNRDDLKFEIEPLAGAGG